MLQYEERRILGTSSTTPAWRSTGFSCSSQIARDALVADCGLYRPQSATSSKVRGCYGVPTGTQMVPEPLQFLQSSSLYRPVPLHSGHRSWPAFSAPGCALSPGDIVSRFCLPSLMSFSFSLLSALYPRCRGLKTPIQRLLPSIRATHNSGRTHVSNSTDGMRRPKTETAL